jgi:hypothetical protein
MRSVVAAMSRFGYGGQPSRMACQPKLAGQLASEGWTTDMFIEAVYRSLQEKK